MLTIILVVGYFLFCVGMAFFLDYRTKKRKLNETAVEYSTGKNSMGLFMAFSLMCGNLISSSYIIGNSSAVIEHDIAYQWTFYGYIIGWALTCAYRAGHVCGRGGAHPAAPGGAALRGICDELDRRAGARGGVQPVAEGDAVYQAVRV